MRTKFMIALYGISVTLIWAACGLQIHRGRAWQAVVEAILAMLLTAILVILIIGDD